MVKNILFLVAGLAVGTVGYIAADDAGFFRRGALINSQPAGDREEFNGPSISFGWNWANGTPNEISLTEKAGWLTMRTKGDEGEPGDAKNRNYLISDVHAGDFTLETQVQLEGDNFIGERQAIVSFSVSDGRWIKLGRYRSWLELTEGDHGNIIQVSKIEVQHKAPLDLRLVRSGRNFIGFYRLEGLPWNQIDLTQSNRIGTVAGKAGLAYAGVNPAQPKEAAHFNYLKLTSTADIPAVEEWPSHSPEDLMSGEGANHTFFLNGSKDVVYRETLRTGLPGADIGYRYSLLANRPWWEYCLLRKFDKPLTPGRNYKISYWARGVDANPSNRKVSLITHVGSDTTDHEYFQTLWTRQELSPNWTQYEIGFNMRYAILIANPGLSFWLDEKHLNDVVEIAGIKVEGLPRGSQMPETRKVAERNSPLDLRTLPHVVQMLQTRKVPVQTPESGGS